MNEWTDHSENTMAVSMIDNMMFGLMRRRKLWLMYVELSGQRPYISGWWVIIIYPYSTLGLFNIAMENGTFIDDFLIKTSIY